MRTLDDLDLAFDVSPHPMLAVSKKGEIVLASRRLESLLGYARGELSGRMVEDLIPEESRPHHPELRSAYFVVPHERRMSGPDKDLCARRKDGGRVPVSIDLYPAVVGEEQIVIASILDVTDRESRREKIRLAMDAAASAMVMVDREGRIVLANSQASVRFGYEPREMLGMSVHLLVPERMRRRHGVYLTSFLQNPGQRPMGVGRDLTACRKDGSEFPVEISLTPIEAHDGTFIMSTIIDISARKRAAAEIRAKNEDLSRLTEELSQFAYSASHDLRAPLSTIGGLLRFVESDLSSGNLAEAGDNVRRCLGLVEQLGNRVEDALALARSENVEAAASEVRLEEFFGEVTDSVAEMARRKAVSIQSRVEGASSFVTDGSRLFQVVSNLVSNAVKYSSPERPERWVRLRASVELDRLYIKVSDNGRGIPEACRDEVFKMFKRFHGEEEAGTGLGLALVKKGVEKLSGRINFTSGPEGTEFVLMIPSMEGAARA